MKPQDNTLEKIFRRTPPIANISQSRRHPIGFSSPPSLIPVLDISASILNGHGGYGGSDGTIQSL